jgi:hypothetical protein
MTACLFGGLAAPGELRWERVARARRVLAVVDPRVAELLGREGTQGAREVSRVPAEWEPGEAVGARLWWWIVRRS